MKIGGLSSEVYLGREVKNQLLKDRFESFVLFFGIASILIQLFLIFFSWRNLPPQIPIFYSRPWGEAILAQKFFLLLLPLISLVFISINYLMIVFLTRGNYFLSRVLTIFSLLVVLMTLYDTSKIIFLIT